MPLEVYDRINESLAKIRRFRPGWESYYTLVEPWSESQVAAFESHHRCRIPDEYRGFLLNVGVAGAGPESGLCAPDQHFSNSGYEERFADDPDLSLPFPYLEAWNEPLDEEEERDDDYFDPKHHHGSILISDRGCALWIRLIITGPCAGQIWLDDRADGLGLRPLLTPDGARRTFLNWYLDWLDEELSEYGHAELNDFHSSQTPNAEGPPKRGARMQPSESDPVECLVCHTIIPESLSKCPKCGWTYELPA